MVSIDSPHVNSNDQTDDAELGNIVAAALPAVANKNLLDSERYSLRARVATSGL